MGPSYDSTEHRTAAEGQAARYPPAMDGRRFGVAGPYVAPDADFWNGWSAVRYIDDQFARQYRRECRLIAAILPLLRPSDAFILCATTAVLERTRRDLDQLGRRQGMTGAVAVLAYRFLKLLRTWFAEIERVTQELTLDELPPDGRRALAQLGAAAAGPAVKPASVRVTTLAEAEADSPNRRQQRLARRAGQLSTQVANMDVDDVALRVEVHIPYFL